MPFLYSLLCYRLFYEKYLYFLFLFSDKHFFRHKYAFLCPYLTIKGRKWQIFFHIFYGMFVHDKI